MSTRIVHLCPRTLHPVALVYQTVWVSRELSIAGAIVFGSFWGPPHVLCNVRPILHPIYAAVTIMGCIRSDDLIILLLK